MEVKLRLRNTSSINSYMFKKTKLHLLILVVALSVIYSRSANAIVDECKEIEDSVLRDQCQSALDKRDKALGEVKTLEGELAYFDAQISLTELKIQNSISEIQKRTELLEELTIDIENLSQRIESLVDSIDFQTNVLQERMRERYKSGDTSPLLVLLGSNTWDTLVKKAEYLRILQMQDQKLLDEMRATKEAFTVQKNLFEEKKSQTEELRAQVEQEKQNLESYQVDLNNQRASKEKLKQQTQNDAVKYDALYKQAIAQANSFKSFVGSAGGGVIGANAFGKGDEGWYYSQRDERWANENIGDSNEIVFEVGCLVTSVAMVHRGYGHDVTPEDIASESDYFFGSTAMMSIPWPAPSGTSYRSINTSQIEGELDDGNPVIVGINAGPYGTHFVVLADMDGDDYVMYDPYYGPDLSFSDYYNTGSIFQAVVFK